MKILVVDDHSLFREGLRYVLAGLGEGVQIVEAGDCAEALARADQHQDVALALLDLHMPGKDGFTALDALAAQNPLLPIVVLSASEDRADMRRALAKGALGFIPKSATAPVMLSALRLVLAGGVYVPPELVDSATDGRSGARAVELTPRQLDVLARVALGKPNKIIAAELGLTVATVKAHMSAAFKVLHVRNRTQAVLAAEKLGFRGARKP